MSHFIRRFFLLLFTPFLFIAAARCESVESSSIETSAIWSDMTITGNGSGIADVTVYLRVGGPLSNTFVGLCCGDKLTASNPTQSKTLIANAAFGLISYNTLLSGDGSGVTYTIALSRTVEDDAPNSVLAIPNYFTLDTPAGGPFSRETDAINLTWSPSGTADDMAITLWGDCNENYTVLIADTGMHTVPAGSLFLAGNTANCFVTVDVSRVRTGSVDPTFAGGTFTTSQNRKVLITSVP